MTEKRTRAPGHLSAESRRFWVETNETYELSDHHRLLLTNALEMRDRASAARLILAQEGMVQTDRFNQVKPHPCVEIERQSLIAWSRILREIGLDADSSEPNRPPMTPAYYRRRG